MSTALEPATIRHDEPASTDQLNRLQYASAFAQLALTCETPMVIGLYGGWGLGKTTLMSLIRDRLPAERCRSVWFDSWLHQYDESPALALLQNVVQQLELGEEGRKLVLTVALAFGAAFMQKVSGISVADVRTAMHEYEEEQFQVREMRSRLRTYFNELVGRATAAGSKRLVFFIDDLDRCSAETTLSMLEALKLYLNLPNCVYFLGVDRAALERSIAHRYGDRAIDEINYLDKIVQLPFAIPPISPESMDGFVSSLLSSSLSPCKAVLISALGDNPRRVKRFINCLALNHQLAAQAGIDDYNPALLAAVLVVQNRSPKLYERILEEPTLFSTVVRGELDDTKRKELLGDDSRLLRALTVLRGSVGVPIQPYLYLAQVAGAVAESDVFEVVLTTVGDKKISVIKVVREITSLGLKEAKDLVEAQMPQIVARANRARALEIVKVLEAAGAQAVARGT